MGLADGADEAHKSTVARRILKDHRPHEGYFPRGYIPYKRDEAWEKFQPKFAADPELLASAERYRKYFAGRRWKVPRRSAGVPANLDHCLNRARPRHCRCNFR